MCVCSWIHTVSLGNVSLEESQTVWAGPHISTVTNRIKPDWVGRQIFFFKKVGEGVSERERERVREIKFSSFIATSEREEMKNEVMSIEKRRGRESWSEEDEQSDDGESGVRVGVFSFVRTECILFVPVTTVSWFAWGVIFLPLALQGIYPPNPSPEQFKSNLETLPHFIALNTTKHMQRHTYADTNRHVLRGA